MEFDLLDDRVAVDDDRAMIAVRPGEILPDAHEVLFVLPLDGDTGANTGMDEEIVSAAKGQRRGAQQGDQMAWHRRAQSLAEIEAVLVRARRGDPEAFEEGEAAMVEPDILRDGTAVNTVQQQILVIALEKPHAGLGHELVGQLEAGRAVRTTIDDIAKQDEVDRIGFARSAFPMRDDFLDKALKQVVTPVNIADSVDALARSCAGGLSGRSATFAKMPHHPASMAQGSCNVR